LKILEQALTDAIEGKVSEKEISEFAGWSS